ncbi:MAG TPA: hypothetical protein PKK23_15790 [Nitrospirales bacterium]|nr:hypothetical protein [Nitrospiraceae bacterium]HNP30508.1 hypothetical protein [Nitrospirales bacterium]
MLELNGSGFPNREIARQVGRSLSTVEKALSGQKQFIWTLPSSPPLTRMWCGGSKEASMSLKRMKVAIGQNLWWLWDVKTTPLTGRGPGRPAAVRPHRALVELAVDTLSLVCGVQPSQVWRWIYPGRAAEIYRHGNRD